MLDIIVSITNLICYALLIFFVGYSVSSIRKARDDHKFLCASQTKIYSLVAGAHLQSTFDQINQLKGTLRALIEKEDFEAAQKLQSVIDEMSSEALKALESYKETFGPDAVMIMRLSNPD